MTLPDFELDRRLVRRRANAAAHSYPQSDFLAREISRRMAERLDYIRIQPKRIVDLGCGPGADLEALGNRYPQAHCLGVDFALDMLDTAPAPGFMRRLLGAPRPAPRLCADATALPLTRGSVSLVWSNLMLNWLHDPLPAFKEIHRALEVGGLVMFSTLGPDTLKELRRAFQDQDHNGRVHRFIDMHDLGDALVQAGFSDPVMDMEMLTLTYPDLDRLLLELRTTGATNAATGRLRGLAGRNGWQKARATYAQLAQDGRLPATVEIIQGHAWKMPAKLADDGRAIISFQPPLPG